MFTSTQLKDRDEEIKDRLEEIRQRYEHIDDRGEEKSYIDKELELTHLEVEMEKL